MSEGVAGTIYLLHFDRPYKHARHYIGWALQLNRRLGHHKRGSGARLMAAVSEAGIGFEIARLWTGTRNDERALKRRKNAWQLCPVCQRKGRENGKENEKPAPTRERLPASWYCAKCCVEVESLRCKHCGKSEDEES